MVTDLGLHETTFRALGSRCRIVADIERPVHAAVHRLEDLEARWSRFIPTSEVSTLNMLAGEWTEVSEVTHLLVRRAAEARHRTDGVMNPLLLNELIACGYDRSHEKLVSAIGTMPTSQSEVAGAAPHIEVGDIALESGRVRIPSGAAFDPGGVGKGLAADLVMDDLLDAGVTWAMVSLGGDLRFGGADLADHGCETHIEDPYDRGSVWGTIRVRGGAVATSSTLSRRWAHAGRMQHHLLDSTSGRPFEGPRVAATVHADEGWWADVVAKTLVLDTAVGNEQLAEWGARALVFESHGAANFGLLA